MLNPKWTNSDVMLSFIVLFTKVNRLDVLRIFHYNELIDEISCDQKIKKIFVPIRYQKDIQFQMISDDNENICEFHFVSMMSASDSSNAVYFLYAKTKWRLSNSILTNDHYMHDTYPISLLGAQINGQIAWPDRGNRVVWKSDLSLQQKNTDRFWDDSVCGETFVKMPGLPIANYRTGYVCFYMSHYYKFTILDIFDKVVFDLNNNKVQLSKNTAKNIDIPIDCVYKIKKIESEQEYLNFIWQTLTIWPAIQLNWYKLEL